jgi:thiol:disulfide interchange protein DsbC
MWGTFKSLTFSALMISAIGVAHAEDFDFKKTFQKIDSVKRIPINGLVMVEAGGQYYLVSDNGRFAILGGKLIDVWSSKEIKNPDDVDRSGRIPLDKLGINQDELSTFTLGTGKQVVTVFMDPTCPHCHNMLTQFSKLGKEYTFKLVMLPLLGEAATEISKKLVCNKNKKASLDAVMTAKYDALPSVTTDCDMKPLQRAIVAAQVIGVNGVPFIVAMDGTVARGEVADIAKFLLEHKK